MVLSFGDAHISTIDMSIHLI